MAVGGREGGKEGGKRRHFEGARDATGKTWERTERTRFFPPSEYSRRNLGGLNLTANRLGWNGASIVPRAPARCAVPTSSPATLEKSRLIFLARETRAFSGLASVRASHSRTRVWRHTRTRTGESRLLSIVRRPLTEDTEDTMPEDGVTLTPTVLWAQRKDRLLITIDLPNPEHPRIDLEDDGNMTFSATAGKDGEERRRYEVSLEFMHPVIAKDSKISVGNRQVFVMVMKTKEVSGRDPISHEPACSNPDTTVQFPRFAIPPSALDITKARIGRDTPHS